MNEYGKQVDAATIEFQRLLPGPIERVWAYLVEGKKRAEWFAGGATELRPGGRAEFVFNHSLLTAPDDKPPKKFEEFNRGMQFEGKVLEVDPPRLLVWSGGTGDDYTETRFELEARGDKVLLTLTETNLLSRERLTENAAGWHAHLEVLGAQLSGSARPRFWERHQKLNEDYKRRLPTA